MFRFAATVKRSNVRISPSARSIATTWQRPLTMIASAELILRTICASQSSRPRILYFQASNTQKLVQLLLVRVLGWAYATSTDPWICLLCECFGVSSPFFAEGWTTGPMVILQQRIAPIPDLPGHGRRGDAPKSVSNPDYSDGRVINTIISLILRHIVITDKVLWRRLMTKRLP